MSVPDPRRKKIGFIVRNISAFLAATSFSISAQVERISVADDESQAAADSYEAAVSDDGTVIAFRSSAENLVAGDANGWGDVFVRDMNSGSLDLVSLRPDGSPGTFFAMSPSISDDGATVVFVSKTPFSGVMVMTLAGLDTGVVEYPLPTTVNGNPSDRIGSAQLRPALSGDGRFVAFDNHTTLQDVYPPEVRPLNDDLNTTTDVFVLDLVSVPRVPMLRASRNGNGDGGLGDSRGASISDDGRLVAFHSWSYNLAGNDPNDLPDIFVRDLIDGSTELVSVVPGDATSGNDESYGPMISGDGGHVVFRSRADDLVAGDGNGRWDVFVRDLGARITTRASVSSSGIEGNHHSMEASISDDGRFVAFRSLASNLVEGDDNARADIFVRDTDSGQTARISTAFDGGDSDGNSYRPIISGNGEWIVFESDATNLVAGDTNGARDIFRAPNPLGGGQ